MSSPAELKKLVDQMPTPDEKRGILMDVDKEAVDKALAEIHAGGRENITGLVGMLVDTDPAADSKARHAIHALVIQSGAWKDDERKSLADALAAGLGGDRPKEVQGFLLRQVQLCGGKDAVGTIAKLLTDEQLSAPAAVALVAIRNGAADAIRAALPKAIGRARLQLVQALGVLRDAAAADDLRKLVSDDDRDTRLTAAWSLATIADAGAVDPLIKSSAGGEGYERTGMGKACLLLADNLVSAGKKDEAKKLYSHVRDTRTDKSEEYMKRAAERGLGGLIG